MTISTETGEKPGFDFIGVIYGHVAARRTRLARNGYPKAPDGFYMSDLFANSPWVLDGPDEG
jgi:hypothetical protein